MCVPWVLDHKWPITFLEKTLDPSLLLCKCPVISVEIIIKVFLSTFLRAWCLPNMVEFYGICKAHCVKKHQITYRYFMFGWLKVKKSTGGLKNHTTTKGAKSDSHRSKMSTFQDSFDLIGWKCDIPRDFFKIPHKPWCDESLSLFSYIMGSKYGFYKKWANLTAIGWKSDINLHPSHHPSSV